MKTRSDLSRTSWQLQGKRLYNQLWPRNCQLRKGCSGFRANKCRFESSLSNEVSSLILPLSILRANQSSRVFYSDGPVTQRDVELADQERLMSVRELLISIFIVIALFEFDSFRQRVYMMRREKIEQCWGWKVRKANSSKAGGRRPSHQLFVVGLDWEAWERKIVASHTFHWRMDGMQS